MFSPISRRLRTGVQRVTAGASALLVLTLGLLAVWPDAHAFLHPHLAKSSAVANAPGAGCQGHASHAATPGKGHPHDHPAEKGEDDAGCVIDLFSQGIDPAAASVAVVGPRFDDADAMIRLPAAPTPRAPRYLHLPERGPPVRG